MDRTVSAIAATAMALLALVGVVYGIATGFFNSKAGNMNGWVSELVVNARGSFTTGPTGFTDFSTANVTHLITNKIVPKGLIKSGAATDPWGNAMAFGSANGGAQGTIQYGGTLMPASDCAKTAAGMSDFVTLRIGSTTFTEAAPPTPVSAAAACATGTTSVVTFQ